MFVCHESSGGAAAPSVLFLRNLAAPVEFHPNKESTGNQEGKEACGLSAGHEAEYFFGVVAAQEFESEAGEAVEHDVKGKTLSFGMVSAAEYEQQGKDDKVQLSFPDFGRP